MTLLQDAPPQGPPRAAADSPATRLRSLPHVSAGDVVVGATAVYWALPLTHSTGGRDVGREAVLAALLLLSAVLVKPWRHLPMLAVVIPVWLGLAALVIPALAPTGWRGADDALGYACAALAFVVAAGWAQTPARRATLAGVMGLAGLDQISHALLPWWGGGNPAVVLTGTFYWHNPFAAYLLPTAVLGAALVAWRSRPWHLVGWFSVPLAVAGIVLSTSRATLAVVVLGLVGVGLYALRHAGRMRAVPRLLAVVGLAVAVTEVLPGPPLFAQRVSPLASTAARSTGGETLAANGGYRVEFWRSAIDNLIHHPLVGTGYHGLIEASLAYTPAGWARSNYAHNGYLQALSDGGLLLGLPLLIGCALLIWLSLRTVIRGLRSGTTEPLAMAAAFGLLAALAHSAVDFDWSHSSLFVMDALLAGLLVAATMSRTQPLLSPRGVPLLSIGVVTVAVLALGLGALGWRDRGVGLTYADPAAAVAAVGSEAARPLATDLAARDLLDLALEHPALVSEDQRRAAVSGTSREATIDLALAAERARVALTLGDRATAASVAKRLQQVVPGRDGYAVELAPLLQAMGRSGDAHDLLRPRLAAALATTGSGTVPLANAWSEISPAGDATAACIVATAQGSAGHPAADCPQLINAALTP